MNILLLSPELFLHDGGIARILRLYLKAAGEIAGPNGRVDSVVLNDADARPASLAAYASANFGEQVVCDRSKLRFIRAALRLSRKADVIVCGHVHLLPVAALAARLRPGLAYCLVAHGIEVWRPFSWLERRALLGAHRILCVSDYTRRQLLRFAPGLAPGRLVFVPNGLDPALEAAIGDAPAPDLSARPRILSVGRLTRSDAYKGFDVLIEALAQVRRELPLARLRIVGDGDDRPRLAALAHSHGVAGAVEFLGRLDDDALRREYAACDFFALPSQREGFGLVYLEAMIHGKACLGARAGGAPEVINADVGELPAYGHVQGVADAIRDLVAHPRDSAVVRGHAATFAYPHFAQRLAAALPRHG